MDKYYIDYRIEGPVKNLDTTFIAPENYIEVRVDDNVCSPGSEGVYRYEHEDDAGRRLGTHIIAESAQIVGIGFILDTHHKSYDFVPEKQTLKLLLVSSLQFSQMFPGETYQVG